MSPAKPIAIYGPTGYTGRQVLLEVVRRGMTPVLVGRDAGRLRAVAGGSDIEVRAARLDDPDGLSHALLGASAVINCAGPFETSADPLLDAARQVGAHYLDFTAEQAPVLALAGYRDAVAQDPRVAVVPAFGFYGGLGDLLASVTAAGLEHPTEVTVAYAVDGWLLTPGSRATAAITAGRRWVWRDGRHELVTGDPRYGSFDYPEPRGVQPVMEDYPLPEAVTIPRHIDTANVRLLMTASTLREIFAPDAPTPEAASDEQRAGTRFTVVAAVTDGETERRTAAAGRDIYGITAPMIVRAAEHLIDSDHTGMLAPSQAVEPAAFLAGLRDHGLVVEPTASRELTA